MLEKRGYTNMQLFHVTDWLPTLVAAAGGIADTRLYKDIDGMNLLGSLLRNETSARIEVLHDMNSVTNSTALRVGAFKILWGKTEQTLGGWYSGGEVRH
jgi:arylsulfatase A-like enzyme